MTKENPMKQLSLSIAVTGMVMLAVSCGQPITQDQLVGDYSTRMNYKQPIPHGMVNVPTGVMKSGYSDEDIKHSLDAPTRTYNVTGFYMDATEITNAEYRQFTNWVRDSMAHTLLDNFQENNDGSQQIDWRKKIKWTSEETQDNLMTMYTAAEASPWGVKQINTAEFKYKYKYFDYELSVRNPGQPSSSYVKEPTIHIYPDTTVWMKQFAYSNNEPIAKQYNWFPAFDEYPVVGVNWHQANAFCHWRTQLWKAGREKRKMFFEGEFRLPTEIEWEWAARGGRQLSPYPWGGPYTLNQKGCYLANFKPNRGDYSADGGLYTVKATAYWPNDYGLYNMSGNVAEWTNSPYSLAAYNPNMTSDLNPDVMQRINEDDATWQRRVTIKGGSWRDPYPYLNISNRDYEFADSAKAHIGFRTKIQYISTTIINKAN